MSDTSSEPPQPDRILAALRQVLEPEAIVSIHFRYVALPTRNEEDDNFNLQCLLSQPSVYQAFGIKSMDTRFDFRKILGFEVVGALANLLAEGAVHGSFVNSPETGFLESKAHLDALFSGDYSRAQGYVVDGGWCEWFLREGMLDKTLLIGDGNLWWLLAITDTD